MKVNGRAADAARWVASRYDYCERTWTKHHYAHTMKTTIVLIIILAATVGLFISTDSCRAAEARR
jgi:hypothetical protein